VDPAPSIPADCRTCGVCCFSQAADYVRVTGDDWTRLGELADRYAHFIGHRTYLRMQDGHCAALAVQPASGGGFDFFCTIHDRRPQTCRDLGRGSPECAGELAAKAARVAAAYQTETQPPRPTQRS
jgi:Fe-S-cluster containining protein